MNTAMFTQGYNQPRPSAVLFQECGRFPPRITNKHGDLNQQRKKILKKICFNIRTAQPSSPQDPGQTPIYVAQTDTRIFGNIGFTLNFL